MKQIGEILRVSVLAFGFALRSAGAAQPLDEIQSAYVHFYAYVQAAIADDQGRALACWHAADLAAAERLALPVGSGIPRVDSDSPLWTFIEDIRDSSVRYRFGPPNLLRSGPYAGNVSIMFVVESTRGRVRKQYLFESDGAGGWWLARPERLLIERGPSGAGRYVRVHERRPGAPWTLSPHLIDDLDDAVAAMAARLALQAGHLEALQEAKIGYLLVHPDVLLHLAGSAAEGVAIRPSATVATIHPHHTAEIARLVVSLWLEAPTRYTLPLLGSGLVGHLGGCKGEHRRVVESRGLGVLRERVVSIDDILHAEGFRALSNDIVEPVSAVFVGFLLDAYGPAKLRDAYLACSADQAEVDAWTAEDVVERLALALRVEWRDLRRGFTRWIEERPTLGLRLAPSDWREIAAKDPAKSLRAGQIEAALWDVEDGVIVRVQMPEDTADVALLWGGGQGASAANTLFTRHFPGTSYRGETHALLLTKEEARLFDYRREIMIAMYRIDLDAGVVPDRRTAHDDGSSIAVRIDSGLMAPEGSLKLVHLER